MRRPDATSARVERVEQLRDVLRLVLQVAVHRHDRVAAGAREPGVHRRVLAEVALEAHDAHARVALVERAQPREGAVGRAVVDEDRLPVAAVQRRGDAPVQLVDRALLVQHRDNDRNVHRPDPNGKDHSSAADVERDGEAAEEVVADEAVVDDPLEHHLGILVSELGRPGRVDPACECREGARVGVAGLVDALDPAHTRIVEFDAELRREALVEDQLPTPHVDLDVDRPAVGERQRQMERDRRPVALDADVDHPAGARALEPASRASRARRRRSGNRP